MDDQVGRSLSCKSVLHNKPGRLRQHNLPGDGLLELQAVPDSSRLYSLDRGCCRTYNSTKETLGSESDCDVEFLVEPENAEKEDELEQQNESFEQHVYNELSAIRDKLKSQFQKLAADECCLQDDLAALEEKEKEVEEREKEVEEREKEVEEREKEVEEREKEVEEREKEVEEREKEVEEREKEVEEREKEVEERGKEVEEREKEVEEREKEVEEVKSVVDRREREVEEKENEVERKERKLREREEKVGEMEQLACKAHDVFTQCIEQEVAKRLQECREQWEEEVARLSSALQEKTRENQRLRKSFDTIKQGNDGLKKQLQEISERNSQLEFQMASIQGRLVNLQRRNEYIAAKQQRELSLSEELARSTRSRGGGVKIEAHHPRQKSKRSSSKPTITGPDYFVLVGTLMSWLCRVHLSLPLHQDHHHHTQQHCRKTLPLLATLLPQAPTTSPKLQLPLLEFTYWAVTHLALKSTLSSTLRRIGEEVYKPTVHAPASPHKLDPSSSDLERSETFFRSPDLHTRLLSTLLILKTLTQVDCLVHAFDTLRQDLKEDVGKELFLTYHGVEVVLPFMKPSNKALCGHAVDIYLQLSVESAVLPHFMGVCSSEEWFAACTALLKESRAVDFRTLEKLSIILQRLSTIKANRRMFEAFQLPILMQELLHKHANPDNPFLTLNLQSILLNLTSKH